MAAPTPEQAFHRALTLLQAGDTAAALSLLEPLRTALPKQPQIRVAIAHCHLKNGDPTRAAIIVRDGVDLGIRERSYLLEAARILGLAGRHADTATLLEIADRQVPDDPRTLNNLGNALNRSHQTEKAVAVFRRLLSIEPGNPLYFYNAAKAFERGDDDAAAENAYRQAIALSPDDAAFNWSLGQWLWSKRRMREAWPFYEKRRIVGLPASMAGLPAWRGEPMPGARLLVHSEQGRGDALQFSRYLPLVKRRVGTLVLQCRPELKALFEASDLGCDEIVTTAETPAPVQARISIMSLPAVFDTDEATIPAAVPYLGQRIAPAALPEADRDSLKVGLVWTGNAENVVNPMRSMDPNCLAPLLAVPGVTFINLQHGAEGLAGEAALGGRLVRPLQKVSDFRDLAAVMKGLDLFVTICTGPLHLAGALGVPTWLLLNRVADFRWAEEPASTPWYPTVRLWRAAEADAWPALVRSVAASLEALRDGGSTGRADLL